MSALERKTSHTLAAFSILLIILLAIYVSTHLSQQTVLLEFIATWSYLAVAILGLISGLNVLIPIPAATLTPLFIAAGLTIPGIITALAFGTILADYISFLFGSCTKSILEARYPKLINFLHHLTTTYQSWLLPFVIFYAAVIPLPNEAILIPLAFSSIKFLKLLIPLIIGNTIHQLLLVHGTISLSQLFS